MQHQVRGRHVKAERENEEKPSHIMGLKIRGRASEIFSWKKFKNTYMCNCKLNRKDIGFPSFPFHLFIALKDFNRTFLQNTTVVVVVEP